MSRRSPTVMVSSTFYDLRQIRDNLAAFISNELGYQPLLSELPSFPVDPDADTVENCRRRVVQDADVFVLVVGGHYGSVDSRSAKSITNIEYLAARAKGIPVLVFIDRSVLPLLSVWRNNPSADFSSAVDDARLFEFIHEIRDVHKVWTHEFGSAQDIVSTLRIQLAYMMREGLEIRQKLADVDVRSPLRRLHGESLRIALERPKGWEYLLFGNVLKDQISSGSDLRMEYDLGIALGFSDYVKTEDLTVWTTPRIAEITDIISTIDVLVSRSLQTALGPVGKPGDANAIVFVAERIGGVYRRAIEWGQQVRRVAVGDEELRPVLRKMGDLVGDIIESLAGFPDVVLDRVSAALSSPPGTAHQIELSLRIDATRVEQFTAELKEAVGRVMQRRRPSS